MSFILNPRWDIFCTLVAKSLLECGTILFASERGSDGNGGICSFARTIPSEGGDGAFGSVEGVPRIALNLPCLLITTRSIRPR